VTAPASPSSTAAVMAVGTRSTPAAGNYATNDNTVGGGSDVNMTSGSLSAGTGCATLGYNANTLYALYFVTIVLLLRIKYFARSSSSSKYEAVACMILVLVYWLSFLWNNAWCKMTKYPTYSWNDLQFVIERVFFIVADMLAIIIARVKKDGQIKGVAPNLV